MTTVDPRDIPVVTAYRGFHGGLRFFCGYCDTNHFHGDGYGHRVAHCRSSESPYKRTGYILQEESA